MDGFGPVQAEVGGHRVEATEQVSADWHPHGDGIWMSWHVSVLTRRDGRLGRAFTGWTYSSIGSLRTTLYRPLTVDGVDFRPNHVEGVSTSSVFTQEETDPDDI